jgi:photosystem II stability/assembly factor-like uncharacterized protein
VAALASDGRVLAWDGETSWIESPPGDGVSIALGTQTFVGTPDRVWTWDGTSWTACGELPATDPDANWALGAWTMAVSDGEIAVASGQEGLFVSDDECATFRSLPTGAAPDYGGIGYAQTPEEMFRRIEHVGDIWLLATFNGVYRADETDDFILTKMLSEDYARGVAFDDTWPSDTRIWLGGYGGAVSWTDDGGATWAGSAVGVEHLYAYDVQPDTLGARTGLVWYSGSDRAFRSRDRGETWEQFDIITCPRARAFRATGGMSWLLGEAEVGAGIEGRLAWSLDEGDTWEPVSSLRPEMAGEPHDVQTLLYDGMPAFYVLDDAPGELFVSTDRVSAPEFARFGAALVATQRGLYWTRDRGDSWHLLRRFERFETGSFHITCLGGGDPDVACVEYTDATQGEGGGWSLVSGDVLETTVEADTVTLVGQGTMSFTVTVDGVDRGAVPADGVLTGLGEGWKDLRFTAGGPFDLDRIETLGAGEVMPLPELGTPDTADSGETGLVETGDSAPADSVESGRPETGDSAQADTAVPPPAGGCCQGRGALAPLFPVLLVWRTRRRDRRA